MWCRLLFRRGDQSIPDRLLAGKLADAARRLGLFACRLLRWLLIEAPSLHFAEHAFPLHFLLQDAAPDRYCYRGRVPALAWLRLLFKRIGRDTRAPGAHAPGSHGRMSVLR